VTGDRNTKWGHNPDTWMVVLTGLLMLIGIGTAWIFYRQFREMSNQTGILNTQAQQAAADSVESSKKTERQLAIAQEQVKTAQSSIEAIRHSLEVQQRAWVGLSRPIVPTSFQLTPKISVQAEIPLKNFGRSPAMKVLAGMMPVTNKEIHERAPRACELILNFVNGTIPKNQLRPGEPQLRRGLILNPDEEGTFRIATGNDTIDPNSADTLYFLGCIAYRDQFGHTRTTRFCVETPWLAKDFKLGQALTSCSIYNDAK
jgi:hypothetical protein